MGQLKPAQPGGAIVYIEPYVCMNASGRNDSTKNQSQGQQESESERSIKGK